MQRIRESRLVRSIQTSLVHYMSRKVTKMESGNQATHFMICQTGAKFPCRAGNFSVNSSIQPCFITVMSGSSLPSHPTTSITLHPMQPSPIKPSQKSKAIAIPAQFSASYTTGNSRSMRRGALFASFSPFLITALTIKVSFSKFMREIFDSG